MLLNADEASSHVQVYSLDEHGVWQPQGSGQLFLSEDEELITVRDHTRVVLSSPILHGPDAYQVTENVIMVWIDPSLQRELALSFASPAACAAAVQAIDAIRSVASEQRYEEEVTFREEQEHIGPHGSDPTSYMVTTNDTSNDMETVSDDGSTSDGFPTTVNETNVEHACEFLLRLAKNDPDSLVHFLTQNTELITQLLHIFPSLQVTKCSLKDQNNEEASKQANERIRLIVSTMRSVLTLSCLRPNHKVFTILVGTFESVFLLISILQHDIELNPKGIDHTAYVQAKISRLDSSDELCLSEDQVTRIKYVYILAYLRESVAPRVIEDDSMVGGPLPQQLNKMRHEIYRQLFSDTECMQRLVGKLTSRSLGILYELMSNMKTCFFPINVREEYAQQLIKCGLLYSAAPLVYEGDVQTRGVITDLIYQITCMTPDLVRRFLISPDEAGVQFALLQMMVNRLLHETDERISVTWRETLSLLLVVPPHTKGIGEFLPFRTLFFQPERLLFENVLNYVQDTSRPTPPSRVVLGFITFVIQRHWAVVHQTLTGRKMLLKHIATHIISNAKVPLPTRLVGCELIRNAVAMCTHRETRELLEHDVIQVCLQPLLITEQRANPMFASAVVSIFTALYIKEAHDVLKEVLHQCGPRVFRINGLRQIFHAIASHASYHATSLGHGKESSVSPKDDDEYSFDPDYDDLEYSVDNEGDANAFLAIGSEGKNETSHSTGATSKSNNAWDESSSLDSRRYDSDRVALPVTGLATPEALQRVANMCRKRSQDDDDDDDDSPLDRLLKRPSK